MEHLYFDEAAGTYCYRFWSRHVGATSGKETGRSYAEPVAGFATEDEAVQHALSVYRGEQPEHMSPELREWQRRAWWIAAAFMLRHRAKEDPNQIPQIAW